MVDAQAGLSRRVFVSGGLALSAATGCRTAAAQTPAIIAQTVGRRRDGFVKDLTHLVDLNGTNQGGKWWDYQGPMTPTDRFFVRNEYPTPLAATEPRVDPRTWTLTLHGNGLDQALTLTYNDLLKMRSRPIISVMECAGNARSLYWEQQGFLTEPTKVGGTGWGFGGSGQAEWQIVPFTALFERAGLKPTAKHVLLWSGVDGAKPGTSSDTGRPIPLSTLLALGDAAGLAFKMNGKDLTADHGAPVRAVVPGWCGAASTKWLTEIKVATHNFWVPLNSHRHVMIGPNYPPPVPHATDEYRFVQPGGVRGPAVTWSPPRSFLTLPLVLDKQPKIPHNYPLRPGERPKVRAGAQMLRGYAYAPEHGISHVDVRLDKRAWIRATLVPETVRAAGQGGRLGWRQFQIAWTARPGRHVLETRVTDTAGNSQPLAVPFNEGGFNFWAVPRFHVDVG
jgi:sulfane dehydrogenase subunit SoxC